MQDHDELGTLVLEVTVMRFESLVRNTLNKLVMDIARETSNPIDPDDSIVWYTRMDKDFLRFCLLRMDIELGVNSANVFKEKVSDYIQLDKMSVNSLVKYYIRDFLKHYTC